MHGVRKVPTTEEQKEIKQKEKLKKQKAFQATNSRIIENRKEGVRDDESLELTSQLLANNPDYSSLWNYRREIITAKRSNGTSTDELENLLKAELDLTLKALMTSNPKSYGAWHHRSWTLLQMATPDYKAEIGLCNKALKEDERNFHCWDHRRFVCNQAGVPPEEELKFADEKAEIGLCNKALKEDERNFHCWDHRRFVCNQAGVPPEEELKFADEKVAENFSNYSVWHYRSTLLPHLHPDPDYALVIAPSAFKSEFEQVQSAFYTDPEDSSAWFYHQWLLQSKPVGHGAGRSDRDGPKVLLAEVDLGINRCFIRPPRCFVLFDTPLAKKEFSMKVTAKPTSAGDTCTVELKDFRNPGDCRCSNLWIASLSYPSASPSDTISLTVTDSTGVDILNDSSPINDQTYRFIDPNSTQITPASPENVPPVLKEVIEKEIAMCDELIEMEDLSKWPLLSLVHCMARLNDGAKYGPKIAKALEDLRTVDPKRARYYSDLEAKFRIEAAVGTARSRMCDGLLDEFNISNIGLTSICSLPTALSPVNTTLLTSLNLSCNNITSLSPLAPMISLKKLVVDNNPGLTSLVGLEHCVFLADFSAYSCPRLKPDAFSVLSNCGSLLNVSVSKAFPYEIWKTKLAELLPNILRTIHYEK